MPPTVVVSMDVATFAARSAGRIPPDDPAIALAGDRALGAAVVAAMAVEFLLTPFAFERPQILSYLLFAAVALLLPRALGGSNRAFAGVIAVTADTYFNGPVTNLGAMFFQSFLGVFTVNPNGDTIVPTLQLYT